MNGYVNSLDEVSLILLLKIISTGKATVNSIERTLRHCCGNLDYLDGSEFYFSGSVPFLLNELSDHGLLEEKIINNKQNYVLTQKSENLLKENEKEAEFYIGMRFNDLVGVQ